MGTGTTRTTPGATALIVEALSVPPPTAAPEPRLTRRIIRTDWGRALPSTGPRASGLIAAAASDVLSPLVVATPIPLVEGVVGTTDAAPGPPKRSTGGYSLARQLGLRVSRIVIDPGHGGHDPGAQGKSVDEAGLVLDVALRVEKLLLADQGTEVILTRRTDEFVPLAERTAIANRESADLFLSIHANASDSLTARGVETYFLNFADNKSAASVAARENAASGQSMAALPDLVKLIALNNKLDESRDFAGEVQRALVDRLRVTNKTVRDLGRQAGTIRRPDRRRHAECPCGDLLRDQRTGRKAAPGQRLPATYRGCALQRRPQLPALDKRQDARRGGERR